MNRLQRWALLLVLPICLTGTQAHEMLGPVQVNDILRTIAKSRMLLEETPQGSSAEEALFRIGQQALLLMKLINGEVEAHGDQQQGLIDLATRRCQTMGVQISYSPEQELYLYDFEAFEEYLSRAPQGKYVADARYALMERSFYLEKAGEKTADALAGEVESKRQFLRAYPDFGGRPDLEMLLAMDLYELSALYFAQGDIERAKAFSKELVDQCRRIVDVFPNSPAAQFALDLLAQLEDL